MPCSRNFLTFHMVMSAVGEDETMMIGLEDLAFFARFGSGRTQLWSRIEWLGQI